MTVSVRCIQEMEENDVKFETHAAAMLFGWVCVVSPGISFGRSLFVDKEAESVWKERLRRDFRAAAGFLLGSGAKVHDLTGSLQTLHGTLPSRNTLTKSSKI